MGGAGLGESLIEDLELAAVEQIFDAGVARFGEEFPELDVGDAGVDVAAQEVAFGGTEPVGLMLEEVLRGEGFVDDDRVTDGYGELPLHRPPGLVIGAQRLDRRFVHEDGGPEFLQEFPHFILMDRFAQQGI